MKFHRQKIRDAMNLKALSTLFSQNSVIYAWLFANMSDIFIFLELISLLVHDKSKIIPCLKTRFLICIITSPISYLLTILNIFCMTGLNDLLVFSVSGANHLRHL